MNVASILAFASCLFAGVLALTVARHDRRSVAHWCFVAGLGVLATEGFFTGLSAAASIPAAATCWEKWRLLAMSFLPGTWLIFSLSFARGNYREFLTRWRVLLAAAFVGPV